MRYNELKYKFNAVLEYLKNNNGYSYKLYNKLCPDMDKEPDSNIVEYMEDIIEIIEEILDTKISKN